MEVFYKGKWGRICPYKWSINDAKVVCRQLGFRGAVAEFIGSGVNDDEYTIPYRTSGVTCTGDESELASCDRTDIDGKFMIHSCQRYKEGAQALCEPSK